MGKNQFDPTISLRKIWKFGSKDKKILNETAGAKEQNSGYVRRCSRLYSMILSTFFKGFLDLFADFLDLF